METGDGRTEDSGGLTRNEENVIRLPRDWLGPPEELVPIGPAARARAAQRGIENGTPPTADAFWSEDSAALHDAVQAPPDAGGERLEPPVGLVPPVAGPHIPALNRLPRLRSPSGGRRVSRLSRRWSLVALPAVALLVVVALIGRTQGPASHPATSALHGRTAASSTSGSLAASDDAAAEKFIAQVKHQLRQATARQQATRRGHARTHARGARPTKAHHRAPTHHATPAPAPTVTEGAATPVATHSSAPVSTSTTPAASTASTSGSGGSKPATGPPGPIGIGSISGGCTVKCS